MPPLAIRPLSIGNYTATTALGQGRGAQLAALRERRGGLRRNDFGPARSDGSLLPTWIGRVAGLEDTPLPAALGPWECRNNRLAWLALRQDGMLEDALALGERHGITTGDGRAARFVIDGLVERTPKVVESVRAQLPADFPPAVAESILEGLQGAAAKLVG